MKRLAFLIGLLGGAAICWYYLRPITVTIEPTADEWYTFAVGPTGKLLPDPYLDRLVA